MLWSSISPYDDLRFSASVWRTANPVVRTHMTEDLCDNYLKNGMSRAEVDGLIGKPDFAYQNDIDVPWGSLKPNVPIDYRYDLGTLGDIPFHMDSANLFIQFDKSDRLERLKLGR